MGGVEVGGLTRVKALAQLQQQIGITDQDPYVPAAAPEEGE